MKIPKGGLHNINQSSQANINDSWNVLATDENNAVLIAVDKCGTKKTVGDTTEIKNSIQALEQENIDQDELISGLRGELDYENGRNDAQDSILGNLEDGLAAKLDKGAYTGNAQNLKNEIDTKQKLLSSFDESILIETDGNIEGNVSLFSEYFNQQVCELNFIPTQIIGVYKDGIKLLPEEFNISLPKIITIKTYSTEKIEIQYTHLKS